MNDKKQGQQEEERKITKHEFFFEIPLYADIKINEIESDLRVFLSGGVDAYNPDGFETTYTIKTEKLRRYIDMRVGYHLDNFENFFGVSLICRRKGNILKFIIWKDDNIIMKVGQLPTIADLQYAEIGKKFNNVLSKQDLHDLKKAIGLSAHGAGAGSLVYLRRIFENIIWETYEKNKNSLEFSKDDFKKKRMDEKVIALKDFLPEQLIKMKHAYAVLGKGIHELSEKECLEYFPVLKLSIELILDQKIEREIKEKKDKSVKDQLKNIADKLK